MQKTEEFNVAPAYNLSDVDFHTAYDLSDVDFKTTIQW